MDLSEQAAAHDVNFVAAMTMVAELSPRGLVRDFGGVRVAASGAPDAYFNPIMLAGPLAAERTLRQAVGLIRALQLPFVIHVAAGTDPAAEAAAASLGLAAGRRLVPCFAIKPPRTVPDPPPDLEIRRVTAADFASFVEVGVAGFEMSPAVAEALYPPAMLDAEGLRAYLGLVDGRPVATSLSVRTGDVVGVYAVATVPAARGRGYGTALTWATLADADPLAALGVLQASDMGRPVYERMGFQLVREFLEFSDPPSPGPDGGAAAS